MTRLLESSRRLAILVAFAFIASCSLEEPSTPLTGTSSQSVSQDGGTLGRPGSSDPTPPPPPPPTGGPTAPPPTPTPTPTGNASIVDPLTNGTSVGEVAGGIFSSAGWQVITPADYIRYRPPTITSGFVEWENLGLSPINPRRELFTIMGMWDPTRGDYRENPFRVHVRKLDTQGHNPPYVRLRFISNGDQHDVGWDFLDWNPNRAYQWRLEWGPSGSGNAARVFVDGQLVISTGYGPAYRPEQHWIEMGIQERAETIVGLVFRNVRIGRR